MKITHFFITLLITFLTSICYAGDRELASHSTQTGVTTATIYEKVHMDTIEEYTIPHDGHRGLKFYTEYYILNEQKPEERGVYVYGIMVDLECLTYRRTVLRWINHKTKEASNERVDLPWERFHDGTDADASKYVINNYRRYKESGTIGDNFRPGDSFYN